MNALVSSCILELRLLVTTVTMHVMVTQQLGILHSNSSCMEQMYLPRQHWSQLSWIPWHSLLPDIWIALTFRNSLGISESAFH